MNSTKSNILELIQCDTDIDPEDPRLFDVICIKKYFLQDFGHEKCHYITPLQTYKCIITKWMKFNPLYHSDEKVDLYRLLLETPENMRKQNIREKFNYGIYEEDFKEHFKILIV